MGSFRLLFPDVCLLVIGSISSFVFLTVQAETNNSVNLAYNCVHMEDEKKKDLPPVFMLHSIMDNKRTWDGIYQDIAMKTGRRVCTVDARNHGDSDWSDDFDIDSMADDVMNFMKNMEVEKAAFVGHSMGGLVTMNIAHRQPEKVEMIIIEDTTPDVSNEIWQQFLIFAKILNQSISFVPANATESEAQDIIVVYVKTILGEDFSEDLPQFKRTYVAIRHENGAWGFKANLDAIMKALENPESFVSRAKRNAYSGNALFIYGTASVFKVFENKETILEYFPKVEFAEVEYAGHGIHPFYPQFLTEVLKFLEHSSDLQ